MIMTDGDIVAEYKQSASPMKQIAILADENVCTKKEIVEVLMRNGCEVPGQYLPKKPKVPKVKDQERDNVFVIKQAAEAIPGPIDLPGPVFNSGPIKPDTFEDTISRISIKAAAFDAVTVIIEDDAVDRIGQIQGVIRFIKALEGGTK